MLNKVDNLNSKNATKLQPSRYQIMDGGGDNQLTVRLNRRPVNRRVQMILQDYQRWEQPAAAFGNPNVALHDHPNAIALMNHELIMPMHLDTEADDSGFESGSESDIL